jgi:hypothetical protein
MRLKSSDAWTFLVACRRHSITRAERIGESVFPYPSSRAILWRTYLIAGWVMETRSAAARALNAVAGATLVMILTSAASAQTRDNAELPAWGISIWGASYHPDHEIRYQDANWGLGVRHYMRPNWRWLGRNPENRILVEMDALRNSNGGLMVPASAGAEYEIVSFSAHCSLFAVATVTVAYYENPRWDTREFKVGPVPGVTLGCGPIKLNAITILRPEKQPLAAIVSSVTIAF